MDAEDNRAVSALFRVFGTSGGEVKGDRVELTRHRGMHRGEHYFLATVVPLTLLVAVGNWLIPWLGLPLGLALTLPLGFVTLNLLAMVSAGKNSARRWRRVLLLCVIWAFTRYQTGGVVAVFAWLWFSIAALELLAAALLLLGKSVRFNHSGSIWWRAGLLLIAHAAAVIVGFRFGWHWALAVGAVVDFGCLWVVLNPSNQWLGRVVLRNPNSGIQITIDDGPDPHDTPKLLNLLDRYETKAIFFMIGEKVRAHPELAKEVLRRGHEIGNHTMTHPQASFWCAGPWRTRREIEDCQRTIEDVTGFRPRWFRAPVGHRNWFTHPIAEQLGLEVMGWNRRGFDAVEKDANLVLQRILPNLRDGDLVLLHEATSIAEEVLQGVLQKVNES